MDIVIKGIIKFDDSAYGQPFKSPGKISLYRTMMELEMVINRFMKIGKISNNQ